VHRIASQIPYRTANVLGKPTLEPVARGVWVMRGGSPLELTMAVLQGKRPRRIMNVYLLEDEGGITLFDAGIERMAAPLADVCARLGGLKRVVLGHGHGDHRGAAPALGAPVHCHPDAVGEAEGPAARGRGDAAGEPAYVDYGAIEDPIARRVMPRLLKEWDGGPVSIAGTVSEGDDVAGFEVREFPGHAPGLIGLWREEDRLALVSDTIYTVDFRTNFIEPVVPHPFYSMDRGQARESVRKLMALDPAAVWAGHADPVVENVRARLEAAASGP
jgi:glyoxylase-like metal-dependent hydrolase (beta-lactamase superfamily II)